MNDCGDCVQTATSREVGGNDLTSLMTVRSNPVTAEPSHGDPIVGLRMAMSFTRTSQRLSSLIEGIS